MEGPRDRTRRFYSRFCGPGVHFRQPYIRLTPQFNFITAFSVFVTGAEASPRTFSKCKLLLRSFLPIRSKVRFSFTDTACCCATVKTCLPDCTTHTQQLSSRATSTLLIHLQSAQQATGTKHLNSYTHLFHTNTPTVVKGGSALSSKAARQHQLGQSSSTPPTLSIAHPYPSIAHPHPLCHCSAGLPPSVLHFTQPHGTHALLVATDSFMIGWPLYAPA